MDKLSQQKIAELRQAFQLFDKDNDNMIDTKQLSILVRSLYQTPTESQLAQWQKMVDPNKSGKFQFADFLALMASEYKQPQTQDELIEAVVQIFKPNGSTIGVKQFRNAMTNMGQKLTDQELNQLFKQLKIEKEDNFNYQEFIKTILTR